MKNLKTLSLARVILKIFQFVYILSFAVFIGLLGYAMISSEFAKNIDISGTLEPGLTSIDLLADPAIDRENTVQLQDLGRGMLLWILIRHSLLWVLGLMIILRIRRILETMQSVQTFYQRNINLLRTIGNICIIIAMISCFNIFPEDGVTKFALSIPFSPLLFGLAAFLMSEIFREGLRLAEDKDSIV